MYSAQYFCPILTKFGIPRQILIEVPGMKCQGNLLNGSRSLTHEGVRTDGRTDVAKLIGFLRD